jgi:translation initiation factor 2B subunit (eIF-2B alpha/beta/delta family)
MNPTTHHARGDKTADEIRKSHVVESADYVIRAHKDLSLSFAEATVLSEINSYHSRQNKIETCSETRICNGVRIRSRLLAAYLRLADAMEVGHERVADWESHRFSFLQDAISKPAIDTLFHWIKSFVVSGITPSESDQRILVEFQIPQSEADKIQRSKNSSGESSLRLDYKDAMQNAGFALLVRYILGELNEELESVESILANGGLGSYHFVEPLGAVLVLPSRHEPMWSSGLTRVVNDLRVRHSPNSSGTASAALLAINDTLEMALGRVAISEPKQSGKKSIGVVEPPERLSPDPISDIIVQLYKNLQRRLESRLCHAELRRITDFVEDVMKEIMSQLADKDCGEYITALQEFQKTMSDVVKRPNRKDSSVADEFWKNCKTLSGDKNKTSLSVLLFGNSETVANVLAHYKKHGFGTLFCYIAEGRPKTLHGARNIPTYVDGEAYARTIREAESEQGLAREIKLRVIPDITAGTVMDKSHVNGRDKKMYPAVDAVVFGANGIFVDNSQVTIAHTCGHLSIAATAKQLGVPVFVLTSAAKIQTRPIENWQRATRDDKGKWLGSETSGLLGSLKEYEASVDWNPREDHVPVDLLDAIFTDLGVCDCRKDASKVVSRLRAWEKEIDTEVQQHRFRRSVTNSYVSVSENGSKSPRRRPQSKSRKNKHSSNGLVKQKG